MILPTHQRLRIAGHALLVVTVALSLMQNLVLNPLAAVPGHSLGQIQAEVAAAGQSLDTGLVIAAAVVYLGLATALLVRTRSAVLAAVLLAGVAPLHWFSSFGPGIALADTYGISGAPQAPWGWLVMALALAGGGVLLAMASRPRAPRFASPQHRRV
ncbi:hypothetical protein [Luteococcus sp.]|uniref:hypothetical protein n=1 Tax=Luteococcus sp. TaxID=1969402 RepID=UPI00373677B0